MPYVGGICIVDSEREIVLQSGESKPDWKYYVSDFVVEDIGFILTNEENSFIHNNNGEAEINMDALLGQKAFEKLDLIMSQDDFSNGNTITNVSFWYEMSMNDGEYSVCVKNVVPVKASEITMVTGILLVIAVFSLVLIIYYVISMFSLIFERRKLSRILATDVVTGGFNLQFFIKKGNCILKKNARKKNNYAVVIIRMEKYRNFCSCHGVKNVKSEHKKYFSVGIYRAGYATSGIDAMFNGAGVAISSLSDDNDNRMVWFNDAMQQAKWISEGKKVVPISVNVSRVHFVREDLAEHICQLVDQFNVPHEYIELELTESAFFDDKDVLLNTIKKLKAYGFEISMDDFGAGYSSLNSLKELPLDVVKLDAGFFRDADESGRGKLIVEDTISLAKKLDMRIVAEGIETREQVDFLAEMNCDLIQGYYFAKPMPINEFEEKAFS